MCFKNVCYQQVHLQISILGHLFGKIEKIQCNRSEKVSTKKAHYSLYKVADLLIQVDKNV